MSLVDTVRQHLPQKYRELAKFLVVGGSAYIVDVGLFTLLSHTVLANKVLTAKAISILIATIFSYVLNREWSFNKRGGRETHHEAMLFFLVNGLAMGLNLIPLAVSQYVLGINPSNYPALTVTIANFIAANIVGTALGMGFRFWAYRKWVFPEELEQYRDEPLIEQAFAEAELIAGEPDAAAHAGKHEASDHPGRHEASTATATGSSLNGGTTNGGTENRRTTNSGTTSGVTTNASRRTAVRRAAARRAAAGERRAIPRRDARCRVHRPVTDDPGSSVPLPAR